VWAIRRSSSDVPRPPRGASPQPVVGSIQHVKKPT
jgi:hypothetical protein